MPFLQLHILSGSQKFYLDSRKNVKTPFAMFKIAWWIEIYWRRKFWQINVQKTH